MRVIGWSGRLRRVHAWLWVPLAVALGVQAWAAVRWDANYDADEAVVGLMARDILDGALPVYYAGQRYLGSLDAYLAAGVMALGIDTPFGPRLVSLALFAVFAALQARLVARFWGPRAAALSLLLLAVPGWRVLWFTSRPSVAFGAMAVCGMLALALTLAPGSRWRAPRLLGIGAVAGLGIWVHPMSAIYLAVAGAVALLRSPAWRVAHGWLDRRCLAATLPAAGFGVLALAVLALFSEGCARVAAAPGALAFARAVLLGVGVLGGTILFVAAPGRSRATIGLLLVLAGFVVGNAPMWLGWLVGEVIPATGAVPSCPTGIPDRLARVGLTVLPPAIGLPPFRAEGNVPPIWSIPNPDGATRLNAEISAIWLPALALALGGLIWFVWVNRSSLHRLVKLAPLDERDAASVALALLFALPIVLAALSGNVSDSAAVRYLLPTWHAAAAILGIAVGALTVRAAPVALLCLVVWLGTVGIGNLVPLAQRWDGLAGWYAPARVEALARHLEEHGVTGAHADYWQAYQLDFLMHERLPVAPYNGGHRFPAYAVRASASTPQAYLLEPGMIAPDVSRADALADTIARYRGAGPGFPSLVERIRSSSVVERQIAGSWDVWILREN